MNARLTLGTIFHGPGHHSNFGLNLIQRKDTAVSVDGDNKLTGIQSMPISPLRRCDISAQINAIESRSYVSINDSIPWLCINVSLLSSAFSSRHQQLPPLLTVEDHSAPAAEICKLQQVGTLSSFPCTNMGQQHKESIVVFCDVGRAADKAKLSYLVGLLTGRYEVRIQLPHPRMDLPQESQSGTLHHCC